MQYVRIFVGNIQNITNKSRTWKNMCGVAAISTEASMLTSFSKATVLAANTATLFWCSELSAAWPASCTANWANSLIAATVVAGDSLLSVYLECESDSWSILTCCTFNTVLYCWCFSFLDKIQCEPHFGSQCNICYSDRSHSRWKR